MSDEKSLTLKDFLPMWMQNYTHFEAFTFLENSFNEWTKSKNTEVDRLKLEHAYDNFKHLCNNQECSFSEKEKSILNIKKNRRDAELTQIYEKTQNQTQKRPNLEPKG
jgi:hypothetical protein